MGRMTSEELGRMAKIAASYRTGSLTRVDIETCLSHIDALQAELDECKRRTEQYREFIHAPFPPPKSEARR